MHILTKRGNLDNVITYEHICDTTEDMAFIERKYITLGSTCVVLSGDSGGMEVYMADSNKEWHDIMVTGGNEMTPAGLELHVCTAAEVQNGKPNVDTPLESTLYLVPSGAESGNLYDEYVYVNEQWELFGGARVSLDGYATESWVQQQGYLTSVPHASDSGYGTIKLGTGLAQIVDSQGNDNGVGVLLAPNSIIKQGTQTSWAVPVSGTDAAAFYGLAKAAGDTTQAQSSNAVGTYTAAAKTAIQGMLGVATVDTTLSNQGKAADAKATGDALATKLTKPATDGTNGQVLTADGNGGAAWAAVAVDDTTVETAVDSYINAHPEVIDVADGSVTEAKLNNNVNSVLNTVTDYTDANKVEVDLSDTTINIRYPGYINEEGVFVADATKHCLYIPVLIGTGHVLIVESNPDYDACITVSRGATTTNNAQIKFADGFTSTIVVKRNTTARFDLPYDARTVYVYLGMNTEAMPAHIYFADTIAVTTYKNIENTFGGTWETLLSTSDPKQHYWWEESTLVVTRNGYTRNIEVTPGQHIRIINHTDHSCHYRLLKEALWETGAGNVSYGTVAIYLKTSKFTQDEDDFFVPEGFHYLSVFSHNGATVDNRWPTSVEIMRINNSGSSGDDSESGGSSVVQSMIQKDEKRIDAIGLTPINQTDSNGWEIPNTVQQMNVVRKSNRFRFLPWTPLRDIPTRQGSTGREDGGMSPAGTAFTRGVPYSSNWQDYKYVGITVSTHTFLTAIHNPYSLSYTENLRHTNPQSAWGRKWIVGNGTNYYGLVCCAFTAAATKCEVVWNNPQIPNISEFTRVDSLEDFDVNMLKVGDVFNNDAHAFVIYAIKRDASNNVTNIKICESGGSYWGENIGTFTASSFKSNYKNKGWVLYRYNNLYKNTDYVPELTDPDQVDQNLENGSAVTFSNLPTYTNEICTFAGDKASFALGAVGHLIVIDYNLDGNSMGSYDRIRLYNVNDATTPVGEWTVAQANATLTGVWDSANGGFSTDNYPAVDMTNHAVVVSTATNPLSAGKYYAVLSDGTTDSTQRTEFEVIDNSITAIEDNDGYYKFTLQDNVVACLFGTLSANDGDPAFSGGIAHELTREEEVNKYIVVPKKDLIGVATSDLYIRMHTKGDYGTACVVKKVFN